MPADRIVNNGNPGALDVVTGFIFVYLLLLIMATAHFIVAKLFLGKVTVRGALILALIGSAYLPFLSLLGLVIGIDQQKSLLMHSQLASLNFNGTSWEMWAGLISALVASCIVSKFIPAVGFVNGTGLFRTCLISFGAAGLTGLATTLIYMEPIMVPGYGIGPTSKP